MHVQSLFLLGLTFQQEMNRFALEMSGDVLTADNRLRQSFACEYIFEKQRWILELDVKLVFDDARDLGRNNAFCVRTKKNMPIPDCMMLIAGTMFSQIIALLNICCLYM